MTEGSILDEIQGVAERSTTRTCTITQILDTLSDKDREGLIAAFLNPNLKGSHITTVLNKRGYRISERTVQRHKSKRCQCSSYNPEAYELEGFDSDGE